MPSYLTGRERLQVAKVVKRLENGELILRHGHMGRVTVDESKCTGCQLCVKACPTLALEMDGVKNVKMIGDNAACIGCSDCVAICKTDAIMLTRTMVYEGFYKHIGRGALATPRRF